MKIQESWKYLSWIVGGAAEHHEMEVPEILPAVGEALGSVCKLRKLPVCNFTDL